MLIRRYEAIFLSIVVLFSLPFLLRAEGKASDAMCAPFYKQCPCNQVPDKNDPQKCVPGTQKNAQSYSNVNGCKMGVCVDVTSGKTTLGTCPAQNECKAEKTDGEVPKTCIQTGECPQGGTNAEQKEGGSPPSLPSPPSGGGDEPKPNSEPKPNDAPKSEGEPKPDDPWQSLTPPETADLQQSSDAPKDEALVQEKDPFQYSTIADNFEDAAEEGDANATQELRDNLQDQEETRAIQSSDATGFESDDMKGTPVAQYEANVEEISEPYQEPTLSERIAETYEDVKETVADAYEAAKEAVASGYESVKDALGFGEPTESVMQETDGELVPITREEFDQGGSSEQMIENEPVSHGAALEMSRSETSVTESLGEPAAGGADEFAEPDATNAQPEPASREAGILMMNTTESFSEPIEGGADEFAEADQESDEVQQSPISSDSQGAQSSNEAGTPVSQEEYDAAVAAQQLNPNSEEISIDAPEQSLVEQASDIATNAIQTVSNAVQNSTQRISNFFRNLF